MLYVSDGLMLRLREYHNDNENKNKYNNNAHCNKEAYGK